jgi:hypothetical protein
MEADEGFVVRKVKNSLVARVSYGRDGRACGTSVAQRFSHDRTVRPIRSRFSRRPCGSVYGSWTDTGARQAEGANIRACGERHAHDRHEPAARHAAAQRRGHAGPEASPYPVYRSDRRRGPQPVAGSRRHSLALRARQHRRDLRARGLRSIGRRARALGRRAAGIRQNQSGLGSRSRSRFSGLPADGR